MDRRLLRRLSLAAVLVVVVVAVLAGVALVSAWFALTLAADDGCAWILGFGGCR